MTYSGRFWLETVDQFGRRMARTAVAVSEDNISFANQVTAASLFTSFGSLSSPMSAFALGVDLSSDSCLIRAG